MKINKFNYLLIVLIALKVTYQSQGVDKAAICVV